MLDVKEAPKTKPATPEVARRVPMATESHPLAFMRRFADEMDRVFEDFGVRVPGFLGRGRELLRREAGMITADWSPRVEIRERDGNLVVRADLPGMGKDDVQVDVTDALLTIQGERKEEKSEKREGYAYNECSYGNFYRAIPLPEGVDSSKATAEFRDGVLEVCMPAPRRAEPKARRLEVQPKK